MGDNHYYVNCKDEWNHMPKATDLHFLAHPAHLFKKKKRFKNYQSGPLLLKDKIKS